MTKNILVSIGIPIYKDKYLDEALKSVLKQTYKNLEIILLNDNSPNPVEDVIETYKDPRISYFKNEFNIGSKNLVEVWNKILYLAKGDLFVMFSDDDVYEPSFIEEIVKVATTETECNVFRSRVNVIDSNGGLISTTEAVPYHESASEYLYNRIIGKRQHYIPDLVFRTNHLKKNGGFIDFPLAWYSDEATCFLNAINGGIITLNKALLNWRYSDSNISSAGNVLLRVEAGIKYHCWLRERITTNTTLATELLQLNKHRIEQNKKNVLIRTARRNIFLGILDIFKNGLIVRKNFGMSYHLIIMGILSFIKNYYRGNN